MKKLDDSHRKILFVLNKDKSLLGSITDGDIRRWILNGEKLDETIAKVCNCEPITFAGDYNLDHVKSVMLEQRIQAIPIIDSSNHVLDILFWDSIFDSEQNFEVKGKIDIPVLIMAGGAGVRLAPFTTILPKPLIPIGNRSVIEVVIDKFREYSIDKFYVSIFHKGRIIKAYFDELDPPYKITYLEEPKPLGTAGILGHLKNKLNSGYIFLTNCDTIINCNYEKLLEFHRSNKYCITLVGSMINQRLPYGICEIEAEGKLVSLQEKPEYSYLVSTGMYLITRSAISLVPKNEFFNMTDLIKKVRIDGGKIGVYPISEKSWMDTGEWKEYKNTINQLSV